MNKKSIIAVVLGFLCLNGVSQEIVDSTYYYYYKGEKQHLSLHTEYAFYTKFPNQTKNIFPFSSSISKKYYIFASGYKKVAFNAHLSLKPEKFQRKSGIICSQLLRICLFDFQVDSQDHNDG